MSCTELTPGEDRALLALARSALVAAVEGRPDNPPPLAALPPALQAPGASFVTLTIAGNLRGCLGSLVAWRPLAIDVATNAAHSALQDPRFPPVSPAELDAIHIEISLLSPPRDFPVRDEADLLARLQPGVHGLIIDDGVHRATFLPAVWEQLPDPRDFVAHLKRKAGLPAQAWPPGLTCQVYTARKIAEPAA